MFDLSALLLRLRNLRTLQAASQLTFILLLSSSFDGTWFMLLYFGIDEKEKNSESEVHVCVSVRACARAHVCRKEAG